MLYLLIAMAICLLVPWLPVLFLRRVPVGPAPPLTEEGMEHLRAQLYSRSTRHSVGKCPSDSRLQAVALPSQSERDPSPKDASAATLHTVEDLPAARSDRGLSRLNLFSYFWVDLIVCPSTLVTGFGLAALWALLFDVLGKDHAKTFPSGAFVLIPSYPLIFGVPALFLGLFSSVVIIDPLTRILLRRRYPEYCHWEQAKTGLEGPVAMRLFRKVYSLFARILGPLMGLWVLLAMNWYARLTENEIALKPLLGLKEEVYAYSRVSQIVLTSHRRQNGDEVVPSVDLHLRFDDEQKWSISETFTLPEVPEERERLLEFLAQKTGKPLTRARLIEDVPGW